MEKIFYRRILLAMVVRRFPEGVNSLTTAELPLQILAHAHPSGIKVAAHRHRLLRRVTTTLGEAVVIIDGKIRVDVFTPQGKHCRRLVLKTGDLFVLYAGGHSLTVLKRARFFEFKNGPFRDDRINLT